MMRDPAWQRAHELFRSNLLRRLGFIHGELNARLNVELEERGHAGLHADFVKVLAHIGREGATAAELAREQGMPRQTMSRLVNQVHEAGYLAKKPDPDDSRARRLFVTRRGVKLIRDAFVIVGELEEALAGLIGEADYADFQARVGELFDALELRYPPSHHHVDLSSAPPRRLQIQLHSIVVSAEKRVAEMSYGEETLVESQWRLVEQVPDEGTRVADLAIAMELSKQRASALVRQLLDGGFLKSAVEPGDARSNRLHLTGETRARIAHRMAHVATLLADLRCALGREGFDRLELHASRLFHLLGGRAPAPLPGPAARGGDVGELLREWTRLLYWMATEDDALDAEVLFVLGEEGIRPKAALLEALLKQPSVALEAGDRRELLDRLTRALGGA